MRFRRKTVVHATLMLSAAGVMVDTSSSHLFGDASASAGPNYQEIDPPHGAAVVAVQFVHTIGESFARLQVFRLSYFLPAPPEGFWDAYLAPQGSDDLRMRAVPVGPESLSRDQRRVLATLLSGSDAHAWEASSAFRRALEK